jgi:ubiquinone/menaquinone biosynthesis C-methylase UbiE
MARWKQDEAAGFEGWDFSYISDRSFQQEPPWSYRVQAVELVKHAHRLLDIDTGGGEFLFSLAPLPGQSVAIESYQPNVAVARDRLAPVGVDVRAVEVGAAWPLDDASFDLVLNRHGHLNAPEIARCLSAGGRLLTQQVGSENLADLMTAFGGEASRMENSLSSVSADLEAQGLVILRGQAWAGRQSFSDVGALIYFLKAIPWIVQGFAVDTHAAVLKQLQARKDAGAPLSFAIERFLIEAQKPIG